LSAKRRSDHFERRTVDPARNAVAACVEQKYRRPK
jgi:hypothetical protein